MGQRSVHGQRRLRTRIGIAALLGATCFGTVATSFSAAQAAPVQIDARVRVADPLAAQAQTALADLQTYSRTGDLSDRAIYETERNTIATIVAGRLAIDPARMIVAWSATDFEHQTALMAAFTQLGVPYQRMRSSAGVGFDCSGLTTYAWAVAGTTLTRQSGSQIRAAAARTQDTALAGDLVYYPGHVMMYLGVDTAIVHAPYTGRTVEVDLVAKRRGIRFGDPTG